MPVLWDYCTACISPQTANRSSAVCQSSAEVSKQPVLKEKLAEVGRAEVICTR